MRKLHLCMSGKAPAYTGFQRNAQDGCGQPQKERVGGENGHG